MPRILDDPTQTVCPNFEGLEWEFIRRCVFTHSGNIPLRAEEAARQLRELWTRGYDASVATWNAQLEQDRAEKDKRDRQACELNEVRRAQLEEEQRREAEKKKPRLNPFDPNRRIGDWIVPRPASYALDKIDNLEYVKLDYFTDLRPSKNIRNDEDLSWMEMLEAKTVMLYFMAKSRFWPTAHSESLKAFFVALERHPGRSQMNVKEALVVYQSRVRRKWFDALARNESFNIGLIDDDLVRTILGEVNARIWERKFDQIRRAQAAFEVSSTRLSSKRLHRWDYEPPNRSRSPSPRAGPSRKRLRSR
ncbi:hypothetical protein EDB85DRAFT_1890661 [Lactarius pseudohatsudake]|nr:hypothetical protein EDB85DRAFT_1890661 [Lactarius pseudohatsudake]